MIEYRNLKWKGNKLYLKNDEKVELIPHDTYPEMYHLKFCWREDKTPEFFNITNAKENGRVYTVGHMNRMCV